MKYEIDIREKTNMATTSFNWIFCQISPNKTSPWWKAHQLRHFDNQILPNIRGSDCFFNV